MKMIIVSRCERMAFSPSGAASAVERMRYFAPSENRRLALKAKA
jgi:hypothetical protein